jgi:hypothetical protein
MSDLIFKLRVLKMLLHGAYEEWLKEIWQRDLDSPYCCSGQECGCMASTVRELYGWHLTKPAA